MIRIADLVFSYPGAEFTLRLPDLEIGEGSRTAIIGPSGCGKTTLLHLMAGILVPSEGSVRVGDRELSSMADRDRRDFRASRVGLVFQEFELLEYLDVLENVLLPFRINNRLTLDAAARERAAGLVRSVGLGDKLKRPVPRLSQGERQRVGLCRALVAQPQVVFADEPTGNLDPDNKQRALDVLERHAAESGTALVVATHDHALLPRFDRVVDFAELVS